MFNKYLEPRFKTTAKAFIKRAKEISLLFPPSNFLIIKNLQNLFFKIVSSDYRLSRYPTHSSAPNSGLFFNTKIIVNNEEFTKSKRRF